MLKLVVLAMAANAGHAELPVNAATYSIATIEYRPTPMEQVGKLQAGILCLPKGKLRWRDVARPDDERLTAALTAQLGKAGLSVAARPDTLFGDPVPLTRYRLKVTVERVKMRLCVPGLGIGEKQPSGGGMVAVRWQTFDRVERTLVDDVIFDVPMSMNRRDARGATGVLNDAFIESAARYAAHRAGRDEARD